MEPRTSQGQMVSYYLKMEPHLFRAAVEDQFARIRRERDAAQAAAREAPPAEQTDKGELVLYRRAGRRSAPQFSHPCVQRSELTPCCSSARTTARLRAQCTSASRCRLPGSTPVTWWFCSLLRTLNQRRRRRRMEELKRSEQRATVEDLMYASVLERFVELGVPMLPRVESIVESPGDLKALTEGVHSREACLRPRPPRLCRPGML